MEHKDNHGNKGTVESGGVQWMTGKTLKCQNKKKMVKMWGFHSLGKFSFSSLNDKSEISIYSRKNVPTFEYQTKQNSCCRKY